MTLPETVNSAVLFSKCSNETEIFNAKKCMQAEYGEDLMSAQHRKCAYLK